MSQYNWQQRGKSEGGQSWRGKDSSSDGDYITFSIPDRAVGKVIGRGGSRIRELQEQSGARIKIGKESNHSGEKEIELQGSDGACQTARRLIEEIVNGDYSGGGGGGGYGGGGGNSYSGGGGGGGGGRSYNNGCFKCGQDGHISRDCPNGNSYGGGGGGGGGGRGACFKCGEGGHISRDCPNSN